MVSRKTFPKDITYSISAWTGSFPDKVLFSVQSYLVTHCVLSMPHCIMDCPWYLIAINWKSHNDFVTDSCAPFMSSATWLDFLKTVFCNKQIQRGIPWFPIFSAGHDLGNERVVPRFKIIIPITHHLNNKEKYQRTF